MSYCVKCGVELDEGAERCPLCGTLAWKPDETGSRAISTKPAEVPESIAQSRRTADGDARVRVAWLRAAEFHFADEHPLALYVVWARQ